MTFGEWLTRELTEVDIKASDLERRTGISGTYIRNLAQDNFPNSKHGKGRPSKKTVERIAHGLRPELTDSKFKVYLASGLRAAGYGTSSEKLQPIIDSIIGYDDEIDENDLQMIELYIDSLVLMKEKKRIKQEAEEKGEKLHTLPGRTLKEFKESPVPKTQEQDTEEKLAKESKTQKRS